MMTSASQVLGVNRDASDLTKKSLDLQADFTILHNQWTKIGICFRNLIQIEVNCILNCVALARVGCTVSSLPQTAQKAQQSQKELNIFIARGF